MRNKNFWILLLLLLAGIVLGGFLGEATKKHQSAVLAEFRTVLWIRHSAGIKSWRAGHYLWADYPHYHGQYHRCSHCTFDLPFFVDIYD